MKISSVLRKITYSLVVLLAALAITVVFILRLPWVRTEPAEFVNGDAELVGTLVMPRWSNGPFPAVVVVHGSGDLPRWIYWSYVRQLVPHGMAVLIFDKRGVGDSTGGYILENGLVADGSYSLEIIAHCREIMEILASDARVAFNWVQSHPEIDASRIGFAGPSQAGWVMPLAVEQGANAAFIVAVSGPAVSCGLEDWYSQLTGEYTAYPELDAPTPYQPGELSANEIERKLDDYQGPAGYDPIPVLSELRLPVLWLLGGRDLSVPSNRSVSNLNALIDNGAPFTVRVYPEANHRLGKGERPWPRVDFFSDMREWLADQGVP